ncbi:MAG TPA: hypothetical protein VFT00_02205 [Nocardioides sp.]|nr:hypothetical protein [Nocardioides sp.]
MATTAVRGWVRSLIYLGAVVVGAIVAFPLGVQNFERRECSAPDFDGECDVAGLEGLAWSVAAIVVVLVAIVIAEIALRRRRGHGV